jgi:hypothetical protein|tara:strand:+ start:298 stop:1233 length:936 start_codon:yes stop_codon:yes gene_type:complete
MANTTSGTTIFEKGFSIADIVEEAFERIGIQGVSGYQLQTARRSLNIMFQEWSNRGLHYWEVENTSMTLATDQTEYTIFRSSAEGASNGVTTTLSAGINSSVTTIPLTSVTNMPSSGKIKINNEIISYTGISSLNLTGATRAADDTTAASHSSGDTVTNFVTGADDILEASFRNSNNIDLPLTKIARSAYQALSNKTSTGQPTQYFVQRFIDKITITLYLTPGSTENGKFLNFFFVKRIQDAGSYSNNADVPYRFVPCMVAGLAYYLAVKFSPERIEPLKMLYEDELQRALSEDGSSSSSFISPKTYYPSV